MTNLSSCLLYFNYHLTELKSSLQRSYKREIRFGCIKVFASLTSIERTEFIFGHQPFSPTIQQSFRRTPESVRKTPSHFTSEFSWAKRNAKRSLERGAELFENFERNANAERTARDTPGQWLMSASSRVWNVKGHKKLLKWKKAVGCLRNGGF